MFTAPKVVAICLLYIFVLPFSATPVSAQKIDSLFYKLENEGADTDRVKLLNKIAKHYFPDQPDSVEFYANQAIGISQSIGYNRGMSQSYRSIGAGYMARFNFEEAMKYFYKGLKIAQKYQFEIEEAKIYILISIVEESQENYQSALEYNKKALKIFQMKKHTDALASLYNSMGNCFFKLKRDYEALEHFEMAYEQLKRRGKGQGIDAALYNIGRVYYRMNNYEKALIYLTEVVEMSKRGNVSQIVLGGVFNIIGAVFVQSEDLEAAESYFNKAMIIALKHNNLKLQVSIYENQIELAHRRGDAQSMYQAYRTYKQLSDSIINSEQAKKVAELSIKYQTQLKESQIEKLSQSKQSQRYAILAFFIFGLLLAVIFFLVIRQLRSKQELAEQTIERFRVEQEKLKREIEKKYSEKEVVKSQLEAAKHEHDKLMFHLKSASEEKQEILRELDRNNIRILDLEKSLESKSEEIESEQLFFSLKNQLDTLIQDKGKTAKAELKRVREMIANLIVEQKNKDFFKKLKETYPKLSTEDLRLSAFMRNHFSNAEIAEFLEITQETLYTRKHRLKRKLELEKDVDITEFLIDFDDKKMSSKNV